MKDFEECSNQKYLLNGLKTYMQSAIIMHCNQLVIVLNSFMAWIITFLCFRLRLINIDNNINVLSVNERDWPF